MKPVAWINDENIVAVGECPNDFINSWKPLYTSPRELSDEEIHKIAWLKEVWDVQEDFSIKLNPYKFARAILKKASEPNTYKPKIVDMVLRTDNQGNVLPQKEIKESK